MDYMELRKKESKISIIYMILAIVPAFLFIFMPAAVEDAGDPKIGLFTGMIVVYEMMVHVWYANKLEFYRNGGTRKSRYTIKKHIVANGESFIGEVVHIREKEYTRFNDGEMALAKKQDVVIRFYDNEEVKYIVKPNCHYNIKLNEPPKRDEIVIDMHQYMDKDECILFNDNGGDLKTYFYNGSIEKNFDESYICKIYKYKNRYVIDEMEKFTDNVGETTKVEIVKREKSQKEKINEFLLIMLFVFLLLFTFMFYAE